MPSVSKRGVINKVSVLFNYPVFAFHILRHFFSASHVHTRGPSHPAIIGILLSYLNTKKVFWHKFAGNWSHPNPPFTYRLQRKLLKSVNCRNVYATVNGDWDRSKHIVPFENPCLTNDDRAMGAEVALKKSFIPPFSFCFAGRVEAEKGIFRLIKAIEHYPDPALIEKIEIVGDGVGMAELKKLAAKLPFPVTIHGSLTRKALFEIFMRNHFFVLPSDSEGFPKVIAEAANFGCIPIVSDVSCIGQYVNGNNGYLWNASGGSFESFFASIDFKDSRALKSMSDQAYILAGSFTYDQFVAKLKKLIIG